MVLVLAIASLAFAAPRVFAVGEGVAESLGLRDTDNNVRARLGAQDDGKYGLRIWDAEGALAYDLTPGASAQAPRVGTSVAALGAGMTDGEIGYLRLGAGSSNSVTVVWDATRSMWVTMPQPLASIANSVAYSSATYVSVASVDSIRHALPGLKDLYDAGMRPEVYVNSFVRTGGTGTAFVRAALGEIADGGGAASQIADGGEISTTSSTGVMRFSEWTPMDVTATPTENHGFGFIQVRASAGTVFVTGGFGGAQLRWAG